MRRLLLLALSLGLVLPASAAAQQPEPVVFLTVGPALTAGGDFEVHNAGFHIDVGYTRPLTASLSVSGDGGYNRFPLNQEELLRRAEDIPVGSVSVSDGARTVLTALGLVTHRFGGVGAAARPFVLGGLGYWRVTQQDAFVRHETGAETLPGYTRNGMAGALGAGIDIRAGDETTFFVEGRYVSGWDFDGAPNLDEGFIPLRIGVTRRP